MSMIKVHTFFGLENACIPSGPPIWKIQAEKRHEFGLKMHLNTSKDN